MSENEPKQDVPFKSELRLIFQGSVPIDTEQEGDMEYLNLKIFLQAISPNITLNGQIMKMLEPCCKKPTVTPSVVEGSIQKGVPNDQHTKMA